MKPTRRILIIAALVGFAALAPMRADEGPRFPIDGPLDMQHIRLEARVDLKKRTFDARATLEMLVKRPVRFVCLDAVDFDVRRVQWQPEGGAPTACPHENGGRELTLRLPRELKPGERIGVTVDYLVSHPTAGLYFFGPEEDAPEAPYVMWSQGQALTNRYWVPCFDHPNEMQTTEIICTVDAPNIAISNGELVRRSENADGTRTFHWHQKLPHVSYLMTLVVGEFISKTQTWRGKPVTCYVREKFKDQIDNSFANTIKMLDFFSGAIGVAYPWAKYDQVCCYNFGGGMENTSATTQTALTLHDERAHLDFSSDPLVAHELAHQWWGDLVTCNDWAHIWLNEGFASYFEALWDEHSLGPDEFAYNMYQKSLGATSGTTDRPIVHRRYKDPDEQFDSRAYSKGAWVLHMLRHRLGDKLFRQALRTYAERYSHRSVDTSDFRKTVEEVANRTLERFFYDWTERPGHPVVRITYKWLGEDQLASVKIEQTQAGEPFHFPLTLEMSLGDDEEPFVVTREIEEKLVSVLIPLKRAPVALRVDPRQAVLMERIEEKPRDLWVAQLERDPSVALRIMAARHFGKSEADADRRLLADRLLKEPFWAVQAAIAGALGESGGDVSRDGLLAAISVKHPKARAAVVRALARFDGEPTVEKALLEVVEKGDASYKVEAAAIRAYADVCEEGPLDVLEQLLERVSDNEIIRTAVLESIGEHCGAAGLDVLLDWVGAGKPAECRSAAVSALAAVLTGSDVEPHDRTRAIDAMKACLKKTDRRLQTAALRALGEVGDPARPALPEIERLARTGTLRVRNLAERTARRIRERTPPAAKFEDLYEQLKELEDENSDLRRRLEKLEARATTQPAE